MLLLRLLYSLGIIDRILNASLHHVFGLIRIGGGRFLIVIVVRNL